MAGARCRSTSRLHRREGQRDAARDRADPDLEPEAASTRRPFERDLYVIRRRIEKQASRRRSPTSTSARCRCRSLIYKGMFLAEQPDRVLPGPAGRALRLALRDLSTSATRTNTFPTWRLAQPFRMLAHNGEINTLKRQRQLDEEPRDPDGAPAASATYVDDIKPVVQAGGVRHRGARQRLRAAGPRRPRRADGQGDADPRGLVEPTRPMPRAHRDIYPYCNAVMEPWDGPAAIGADRRPLGRRRARPQRAAAAALLATPRRAADRRLRDRHGAARRRPRSSRRARVGPGQMHRRRPGRGQASTSDAEIKDQLAAAAALRRVDRRITDLDELVRPSADEPPPATSAASCAAARSPPARRWRSWRLILHPMVEDGKEAIGSMGDDTPLAVLSEPVPRRCSHFFRQNFSQVTNPPIDCLRETRVMTPEDPASAISGTSSTRTDARRDMLHAGKPGADQRRVRARCAAYIGAHSLRRSTAPSMPVPTARPALRARASTRIRARGRGGASAAAARPFVLTDEQARAGPRADADDPGRRRRCTRTWSRQGLRTFTSLNVRSAECLDAHYFAVLIGVGATTVNAYLAQESIADRHRARAVRRASRSRTASPATRRRSTRAC